MKKERRFQRTFYVWKRLEVSFSCNEILTKTYILQHSNTCWKGHAFRESFECERDKNLHFHVKQHKLKSIALHFNTRWKKLAFNENVMCKRDKNSRFHVKQYKLKPIDCYILTHVEKGMPVEKVSCVKETRILFFFFA